MLKKTTDHLTTTKVHNPIKNMFKATIRTGAVAAFLAGPALAANVNAETIDEQADAALQNPVVQRVLTDLEIEGPAVSTLPRGQFQVNAYTTSDQETPDVAMDAGGNFVVVWASYGSNTSDSSGQSVQAQRYNSAGRSQGPQIQVNTNILSTQSRPAVAMDEDGDFVVVWQSYHLYASGHNWEVQGQRFDKEGNPAGIEFEVNSLTTGGQFFPDVAMDADGDFVVAWTDFGNGQNIKVQRFSNDGARMNGELLVNTYTSGYQRTPAVAMDKDGNFVVVWQSGQDVNTPESIKGQRFNKDGGTIGAEIQIDTYTNSGPVNPAVDMDHDGDFVVVWQSKGSFGNDDDVTSIQARRYANDGTAVGFQYQVNEYTTANQVRPKIAMDMDGDFAVTWENYESYSYDFSLSLMGRRFKNNGSPDGPEIIINSYTSSRAINSSVAMDHDGDLVVTWQNYGSFTSDQDGQSIQAKRYFDSGEVVLDALDQNTSDVATDSDGDFVVVWQSYGSDGTDQSMTSIQGQRYNNAGEKVGGEFQVNTNTLYEQVSPAVAMDSDGDFVVVWTSFIRSPGSIDFIQTKGQRYNKQGVPQGGEFLVSNGTAAFNQVPDVAMDANGNFVVAWNSEGFDEVSARRYAANGTPLTDQFQVNTFTTGWQRDPSVAMDADGDFVIIYGSNGSSFTDQSYYSILGQRFDKFGTPAGSEFQVNEYTTGNQFFPSVAMDSNGNFVVTWTSNGSNGDDYDYGSIQARRFDNSGTPLDVKDVQVNSFITGPQFASAIAMQSNGSFVVTWQSYGSPEDDDFQGSVQGQRFSNTLSPQGGQFQVNTYTTNSQLEAAVAMDSDGDFVITWTSEGSFGLDDFSTSIQLQRYVGDGTPEGNETQVSSYGPSPKIIFLPIILR